MGCDIDLLIYLYVCLYLFIIYPSVQLKILTKNMECLQTMIATLMLWCWQLYFLSVRTCLTSILWSPLVLARMHTKITPHWILINASCCFWDEQESLQCVQLAKEILLLPHSHCDQGKTVWPIKAPLCFFFYCYVQNNPGDLWNVQSGMLNHITCDLLDVGCKALCFFFFFFTDGGNPILGFLDRSP